MTQTEKDQQEEIRQLKHDLSTHLAALKKLKGDLESKVYRHMKDNEKLEYELKQAQLQAYLFFLWFELFRWRLNRTLPTSIIRELLSLSSN